MIKQNTWEEIYTLAKRSVGDVVIVTGDGANPRITLTPEGLVYSTGTPANAWLPELLRGEYELVPWEPKEGEMVYYFENTGLICCFRWGNGPGVAELALLSINGIFRTETEAEAHIPEIHEKYRKIREGKRFE